MSPSVQLHVSDSPIHGKGLFASEAIAQGVYIGFYEGNETRENGTYVLWVQQDPARDAEDNWLGFDGTGDLRFLNHSKKPNCKMDGQELYSARDIDAGEELTIDYGEWFEEA